MGKYALIGLNGVDMPGGIKNARGFIRKDWTIGTSKQIRVVDDEEASGDEGDSEDV